VAFDPTGWLAVALTQVFYIPYTLRILRTGDVEGYSLVGWLLLFFGLGCDTSSTLPRRETWSGLSPISADVRLAGDDLCISRWREGPRFETA